MTPIPKNEAERLHALYRYHVLDTPPEVAFDDLTRLAAQICGTPLALITLIDKDRQWFKAKLGFDPSESPRGQAFCAHAIMDDKILIVPEPARDGRFADNPWVKGGPQVRFYAGAPLLAPGGVALGTLCVLDRQPRDLTDVQRQGLVALARQVVALLELRHKLNELRTLEETLLDSEKRFRAAFYNSSAGKAITDADGRVVQVNHSLSRILGFGEMELMGEPLASHVDPADAGAYHEAIAQLTERKAVTQELELRFRDKRGEVVWTELAVCALLDSEDHFRHVVHQIQDIGRRKRAENEAALATEAAIQASLVKSEFLANMSHEIRTPLNAIIGLSDLLSESELDETQRDYSTRSRKAADTLLGLINDILDLSKIEAGKMDVERIGFDPRETVARTVEILAARAAEKGITLQSEIAAEVPPALIGDPQRLRQVLINLIGNAIKFTSKGGVKVRVAREATGALLFAISDTGIGIAADKVSSIFGRFTQADTSITRQFGGTGLGLSICRQLVGLMGGEIWVESKPGTGATFSFRVPFDVPTARQAQAAASAKATVSIAPGDLPSLRILVAEDGEDNRHLLAAFLKGVPGSVEFAFDGREALEKFKAGTFDLVLMDMQMPVLDGYAATREIRRLEQTEGRHAIPVIALTAHAMAGSELKSYSAGCTAHLTKPLRRPQLLNAIREATNPSGTATLRPEASHPRVEVESYLKDLIPPFLENRQKDLVAIAAALKLKDFETIAMLGHRMRGAAGGYGFHGITDIGANLETAAENKNAARVEAGLRELRTYLETMEITYT